MTMFDSMVNELMKQKMAEVLRADLPHLSVGREKCLDTDPHRGVSCRMPMGHEGDHISISGFPWENEHYPRPKYEGASEADLAAVSEILEAADHLEDAAALKGEDRA